SLWCRARDRAEDVCRASNVHLVRLVRGLGAPGHRTHSRQVNDALWCEPLDPAQHCRRICDLHGPWVPGTTARLDNVTSCAKSADQMPPDESVGTGHKDLHLSDSCAASRDPRPPSSPPGGGSRPWAPIR